MKTFIKYYACWGIKLTVIVPILVNFLGFTVALCYDIPVYTALYGELKPEIWQDLTEILNPHHMVITLISNSPLQDLPFFSDVLSTTQGFYDVAISGDHYQDEMFQDMFEAVIQVFTALLIFKFILFIYSLIKKFTEWILHAHSKLGLFLGDGVNYLVIGVFGVVMYSMLNQFLMEKLYKSRFPLFSYALLVLGILVVSLLVSAFTTERTKPFGQRILDTATSLAIDLVVLGCIYISIITLIVVTKYQDYTSAVSWGVCVALLVISLLAITMLIPWKMCRQRG